jgi:hypothetical protein
MSAASILIAIVNLIVLGGVIAVWMTIPDGWMNTDDMESLVRNANWSLAGNWAIRLFPVAALTGMVLGIIAFFQKGRTGSARWAGMLLNLAEIILWTGGIVFYQLFFHLDRFYVK